MVQYFAPNQPVLVESAEAVAEPVARPAPRSRYGARAYAFAAIAALFWTGFWAAYLLGYLGIGGLAALDLQQVAIQASAVLLPPLLFFAIAAALARSAAMQATAETMLVAADKLFAADETAARSAARLSRAVRRELDTLNTGLDAAFQRVRSLESLIEHQIAALDEAGARAEVRGDSIALRLGQETQRIDLLSNALTDVAVRAGETVAGKAAQLRATLESAEDVLAQRVAMLSDNLNDAANRSQNTLAAHTAQIASTLQTAENAFTSQVGILSGHLNDAAARANEALASRAAQMRNTVETAEGVLNQRIEALADALIAAAARASETVAGRTAQLKATLETVEGTLKMAAQSLDVQAAGFRAAANAAADAPLAAATELGRASGRIQEVSDAAMGRAEFVLARYEKHRAGVNEQLHKLKDDADAFETALSQQRTGMENAIATLAGEAQKFESVTGDAERHLDLMMVNAATRANQLTAAFSQEAEKLRQTGETAAATLNALVAGLRTAGGDAQALLADSSNQAKQDARLLVGEAMAECERLLRTAGEMSAEAGKIRELLAKTTDDMERHLIRLPGLAQEEAKRVRQLVASETEQILDLSARTLSTIHSRSSTRSAPEPIPGAAPQPVFEPEPEGLKGLARKLTARPRKKETSSDTKAWEMKALLAAVESGEAENRSLRPGNAAALGALEVALADLAIDLSALDQDAQPRDEDWKRYLAGDRAIFARKLAGVIDANAVDRIATLYRDDERFHAAADSYLSEFESLLAKAREGDGGGLLTSTMLSADTGKIYLAIAYALGRL
ncbi:MAG TPA: hypothetical protein VHV26_00360 [Rhizomicrobium sp.]|nr:hypothetical protein [Rhizomicrobium sp.]